MDKRQPADPPVSCTCQTMTVVGLVSVSSAEHHGCERCRDKRTELSERDTLESVLNAFLEGATC